VRPLSVRIASEWNPKHSVQLAPADPHRNKNVTPKVFLAPPLLPTPYESPQLHNPESNICYTARLNPCSHVWPDTSVVPNSNSPAPCLTYPSTPSYIAPSLTPFGYTMRSPMSFAAPVSVPWAHSNPFPTPAPPQILSYLQSVPLTDPAAHLITNAYSTELSVRSPPPSAVSGWTFNPYPCPADHYPRVVYHPQLNDCISPSLASSLDS